MSRIRMGRVKRTNKSCHKHKPLSYIIGHFHMQPQQKQHTTATHYCNKLLQQITPTHYCKTLLQHTPATHHYFHTIFIRSHPITFICSHSRSTSAEVRLQHTTATHYCNTLLQHTTATHYCNKLLQHTTATHCCITSPSACEP